MPRLRVTVLVLASLTGWFASAAPARAQLGNGGTQLPKGMGGPIMPTGSMFGSGKPAQAEDPGIAISETFTAWLDSAVPRSGIGLRFDAGYYNRHPSRAEYYHPKGGSGTHSGFPKVETRVDFQDIVSMAEYSWTPWFSIFVEGPYRWINPEVNRNRSGAGDVRYGLKLCTWSSDDFIATILFRLYQPVSRAELGTGHWSIEPGLLAAYRLSPMMPLEGELRYWIPIDGSDFAGHVLRYGASFAYGARANGMWYTPVIEGIGWTVLSGKTAVASSEDSYLVQSANGQTIVNGYAGIRWGFGYNFDMYLGYGRSFTGHFWQRDMYRFEVRYAY